MSEENNGGIWIKASDELPEKGYYIVRRQTLDRKHWMINEQVFNPKYEDNVDRWKSWKAQWLRPCAVVEKADADKLVEALEKVKNECPTGSWFDKTCSKAINQYKNKYK